MGVCHFMNDGEMRLIQNKRSDIQKTRKNVHNFSKKLEKSVDFSFPVHYTVIKWSKVVEKWSKMERGEHL